MYWIWYCQLQKYGYNSVYDAVFVTRSKFYIYSRRNRNKKEKS